MLYSGFIRELYSGAFFWSFILFYSGDFSLKEYFLYSQEGAVGLRAGDVSEEGPRALPVSCRGRLRHSTWDSLVKLPLGLASFEKIAPGDRHFETIPGGLAFLKIALAGSSKF